MQKFNDPVITDIGRKMLIDLGKSKGTIVYTKAVLYGQVIRNLDAEAARKLTSLSDPKKEAPIGIRDADTSDNTVSVEVSFSNEDLKDDITFNSLGWFAKIEDQQGKQSSEVLLAVTSTAQPEVLAAGSPNHLSNASIDIELDMALSNAAKVELTVNQAGIIHKSDLDNAIHDVNKNVDEKLGKLSNSVGQKDKEQQAQIKQVKKDLEDKIATAGKVKTINNISPDANGNILLDPTIDTITNYDFDNGSAHSVDLKLSDSHVLGQSVLTAIRNRLNAREVVLNKKINDGINNTYSKVEIDSKVAQAGKVKTVDGISPDSNGNIDISNKINEPITKLKNNLETQINSKASQTDLNTVKNTIKNTVVKSVAGMKPDNRGNVPVTIINPSLDFNNDENPGFTFMKGTHSTADNLQFAGINTLYSMISQIKVNTDSFDSLYDTIDQLDSKIKESNTKINSNTKRIEALEKKETSHISPNETDALNYSKAHPGIPVFVAE